MSEQDKPRPGRPNDPQPSARADSPRPEMRTEMRGDDPRERAAKRAAELRSHGLHVPEGGDEFNIDQSIIPDGWSYEWRVRTVLGKEDPAQQVALAQSGWEPVPVSRHPAMMPKGYTGRDIERKGMVLMERPMGITQEMRRIDADRARQQVRHKEEQLNQAPKDTFERDNKGTSMRNISKSYEHIPIPK